MTHRRGIVYLVGAGPGDPGLITVRGQTLLQSADVVIHDRLIGREQLALAPPAAERIDAGKRPGHQRLSQEQINELLVDRARQGHRVVRLKGGDPFVYGRGFEELQACRDAGIDCVVVPGLTSAIAGPAAAGIPVTLRCAARSFAVVTAETASDDPVPVDFAAFAGIDTLIILMGRAGLRKIAGELLAAGRDRQTPVACIERATTPGQRVEVATLATIADHADRVALAAPMITVVGETAALANAGFGDAVPGHTTSDPVSPAGIARKRILITRPRSTGTDLGRRLAAAGAVPVHMPLLRISYDAAPELDDALARLNGYRWLVFTSVHGVRAFRKRVRALGRDVRTLGSCRIAVVGRTTARELNKLGLVPDLIPPRQTADDLVQAVRRAGLEPGATILFPRGQLGGDRISQGLRAAGAIVDDVVVYRTLDADPPPASMEELRRGVDAILLFSPSAVRRFAALGLSTGGAAVACVGPTTADAVREAGMTPDIVAVGHDTDGMLAALERHFSPVGART